MSDDQKPAPDTSLNTLDLKFLPSWLKEDSSAPPNYANFDGEDRPSGRDRRDGRSGDRRGPRPGGPSQDKRGSQRPPQGARPGPGGQRPPENRGPRRSEGGRPDSKGPRRSGPPDRQQDRRSDQRPAHPEERPAHVTVSFLPEEHALEKVTEQLKSAPIAYPLFGVAKMFLQRPERHHVVVKTQPGAKLFKLESTSHLSTDRHRLELIAFQELWKNYFRVEVTEAPEIKGNFTSVARSRLTGKVFGPTSHHSFQPALHKEYEERFSRRMSFAEYKSNLETTNNPEAIELWKTESRRVEKYHLLTESEIAALSAPPVEVSETPETPSTDATADSAISAPAAEENGEPVVEDSATVEAPAETVESTSAESAPEPEAIAEVSTELETEPTAEPSEELAATPAPSGKSFATKAEAEDHFRKEILPTLIVEVETETLTGPAARHLTDRRLGASIRTAWESESRYPLGLVNAIRVKFNEQNLHIFKFKKKVLLISSLKPAYLDDRSESLSPSIKTVLQTIHAQPGIDRKGLAEKILGNNVGATEDEKLSLKHSLISDLYWLVRQGNVIEFSDGTFDLPMGPKALQAEAAAEAKAKETPVLQAETAIESTSNLEQEQ